MTRLGSLLRKHRRVALDTSIFICHLEANPSYVALTDEVFQWLERPSHSAVTSTLTMTELLVQPYRQQNEELINRYFGLLSSCPNLEWIAPDLTICDTAARVRAQHNLRTPDSLQVGTAICAGASAFLTNDSAMTRVREVAVVLLDELREYLTNIAAHDDRARKARTNLLRLSKRSKGELGPRTWTRDDMHAR